MTIDFRLSLSEHEWLYLLLSSSFKATRTYIFAHWMGLQYQKLNVYIYRRLTHFNPNFSVNPVACIRIVHNLCLYLCLYEYVCMYLASLATISFVIESALWFVSVWLAMNCIHCYNFVSKSRKLFWWKVYEIFSMR